MEMVELCIELLVTISSLHLLMIPSSSGHSYPHKDTEKPTGFHDPHVVHDQEHINEHLEGLINANASTMSREELEFHYFKLHDFDNNTMLDGLEILKALTHLLPYEDQEDTEKVDPRGKTMEQVNEERRKAEIAYYTEIVDQVLEEDDIDNDGYLSYAEYMMARRRDDLENDSREH